MMRIITGSARGTRLATLAGENTRPTAERTKEAVFSILQSVRDAAVLDLFAGSGQMALEALSRGAKHALAADHSKDALAIIRANAEKTHLASQCEIRGTDALRLLSALRAEKRRFDLVFLDPPYALRILPEVLARLCEYGLLEEGARIVCESAREEDVFGEDLEVSRHYDVLRVARYGAAFITVLSWKGETV